MALEPAWVWAILSASEALAVRQAVQSFRAPSRLLDQGDGVREAKEDGYSGSATTALADLTERVGDLRAPAQETEDGLIEPQPVADILAMTDIRQEVKRVTTAFEEAVDARRCARRCRGIYIALGVTLLPVILLIPVPLWPHLSNKGDDAILTGASLHVANTLLGVAVVVSLVLFGLSIRAEHLFAKSLVANRPDNARIGS